MTTLYVAVGGMLGTLARFGIGRAALRHGEEAVLVSTLAINVAGSFLIGLIFAAAWFQREVREGLEIGFLGGFTTFSAFSLHTILETEAGRPGRAALYVALSVAGSLAAGVAGYALGRNLG